MTIEELKDKMETVFADAYSAQMYFVLRRNGEFLIRLADIDDESTEPEIAKLFSDYAREKIIDNSELQICELSTADERSNAIYHYDYEEYPEELSVFNNFDIEKAIDEVDKFNFLEDDLGELYGYIIYLGTMENGIMLFKKHYNISLIKRDSFLLGAIKSEERFERISGDDIVRLNGAIQLLRVENEIFVTDINVLERNMGFNNLIVKAADETVQAIDEMDLLEDIQVLKDVVEDISFARKLSKVKKASAIFKYNISSDEIVEFTKNTEALVGIFKYSEDGKKIRLDTKKSKVAFIKLMNDSFLHSELTKQYYDASAKDNITKEN